MAKVLNTNLGADGILTTVMPITNTQTIADMVQGSLTAFGAQTLFLPRLCGRAVGSVIPELRASLGGGLSIPIPTVSVIISTAKIEQRGQ